MTRLLDAHLSSRDFEAAATAILDGHPRPLSGVTPQGIPKVLAAMLEHWEGPATSLLEYLSGTRITIQVLNDGKRPLTDREVFRLASGSITRCRYRNGLLRAGQVVAASVSLIWLPPRLPYDACRQLDEGTRPAGTILAPYGMRRVDRLAMSVAGMELEEVTGQPAAAVASAALEVDGRLVGLAEEHVTMAFAESLA